MKTLTGQSIERMKKVFLAFQINDHPQGPLAIAKTAGITRDQVNYLIRAYPDYWQDKGGGHYSLSGSGELALAALCGQSVKIYSNEDILETVNTMASHNKQIAEAHLPKHAPEPKVSVVVDSSPKTWQELCQYVSDNIEPLYNSIEPDKRATTTQFEEGNVKRNVATAAKLLIQAMKELKDGN